MTLKKNIIIAILGIGLLTACSDTTELDQYESSNNVSQEVSKEINRNGFELIRQLMPEMQEIRNIETGVHYYWYYSESLGFQSLSESASLTPIIESDGSFRINDDIGRSGGGFELIGQVAPEMQELRDVDTGAHYYWYYSEQFGMKSHSKSASLTPVIESDGSFRISTR